MYFIGCFSLFDYEALTASTQRKTLHSQLRSHTNTSRFAVRIERSCTYQPIHEIEARFRQLECKVHPHRHMSHFLAIQMEIELDSNSRWQGWRCVESTCLPPMWPGFDFRTRRQMWIDFVGSLLCYERFSPGYSGFPLSPKTNI